MKETTYTITFRDGTITKVVAFGAIQAVILAQAAAILDDKLYEVDTVQNGDNGCVYQVGPPKLKAIGGCHYGRSSNLNNLDSTIRNDIK